MLKTKALLIALCLSFLTVAVGHGQQGSGPFKPGLATQDYADILNLYALYSHAFDSGADNGNMYAQVFTTDGVLVDFDGKTYEGRAKLAEHGRGPQKTPTAVSQFLYNLLIEPAPGGAVGKSYVVVTKPGEGTQPLVATNVGQYHDVLVKTAEGWRIKKRTFVKVNNYPKTPPSLKPLG